MPFTGFQDEDVPLWEEQKHVFFSEKRHLESIVNFSQLLPDLLRLRFFTDDQLTRHNNFDGATSDVIIRALSERISSDRHVFPLLLVTLRRVDSTLVDELHDKVSMQMTRRSVTSSEKLSKNTDDDIKRRQQHKSSGDRYDYKR